MTLLRPPTAHRVSTSRGFTLLEVLASMAMTAVMLAALQSVFYTAIRARERTYERIEAGQPNHYVIELLKRDLVCAAPPSGILAGPFVGETEELSDARLDTLEFCTASGVVDEENPWGDVQKLLYSLEEPEEDEDGEETPGWELVRSITRNLLPLTEEEEPEEQRLLSGVNSFQLEYYDGDAWTDQWDSTTVENETPVAMKVRIDFEAPSEDEPAPDPIEAVIAFMARTPRYEEESDSEDNGGGERPKDLPPGDNPPKG
jgi:type II secretion system protein J